jgi:hypothetical protein
MKRFLMICAVVAFVLGANGLAKADLVAYWPFDEGSGTTACDPVGHNDGTVIGALWTTGIMGSALDFDGTDDIVVVGNHPSLHVTDLTMGMWIYPDLPSYKWAKTLLGYGGYMDKHEYFMSIGSPTGDRKIGAVIGHGTSGWRWSSAEVNQGEWSHVAATFDSSSTCLRIYINGQLVSTYSVPGPIPTTTNDLWIGNRADMPNAYVFDGCIDEVAIYNRVLTGDEILDSYVSVKSVHLVKSLTQQIIELNLQNGISNSLDAKLDAALQAIDDLNENNDIAAINTLQAFINAVKAQRGNKISSADADILIAAAQEIIDLLLAG